MITENMTDDEVIAAAEHYAAGAVQSEAQQLILELCKRLEAQEAE